MLIAVEIFFALASGLLAATALRGSTRAWRLESHPIDFAMRILAGLWILYLLVSMTQFLAASQPYFFWAPLAEYIQDAVYECVLVSVAFFLLTASGTVRPWIFFVLGLQLTGGLMASSWLSWTVSSPPAAQWSWTAVNLLSASVVTGLIMRQTRFTHSRRSWLALAGCAMGLGLWLYHAAAQVSLHKPVPVAFHMYAFLLFVIWKLISLNNDADKTLANAGTSFSGTTNFKPLASVASDDDFIALAVRGERQRISYELHDNIGSQIVSVLFAMQATDKPQKRFVMLSLEQCLTDLKMMVDALDSFDENVTLALGRLRYRVQHALDRQGIKMRWDVEISDELDAVRGLYAQQVLRIAQESLANVMRHSNASSIRVSCRYMPEFCHLLLEVRDDGVGIAVEKTKKPAGHGLEGMKRRAAAIGGVLLILSNKNGGTCVRLTLPLPHLKVTKTSVAVEA